MTPIPLNATQLQALERARLTCLLAGVPPGLLAAYDECCEYPSDLGLTFTDFCHDRTINATDAEQLIQNAAYLPQLFATSRRTEP